MPHKLTLNIDEELHEKLKEAAEDQDRSVASVARRAIRQYFDTLPAGE